MPEGRENDETSVLVTSFLGREGTGLQARKLEGRFTGQSSSQVRGGELPH